MRFLAGEAGIRQFLDIGTGLPTMQNTHEVAQAVRPTARVVYVDNDPLVLAHARALLATPPPRARTTYIDADYNEPELIIAEAREVLDFDQPIARHVHGRARLRRRPRRGRSSIIARVAAPCPSGSYLALWDGTDTSEARRPGPRRRPSRARRTPCAPSRRSGAGSTGLELVEPGLVPVPQWRPVTSATASTEPFDGYGAVARKPLMPAATGPLPKSNGSGCLPGLDVARC